MRLIARNPGMQVIIRSLFQALPDVSNVFGVVICFQVVFAILGMQLFMGSLASCSDPTKTTIEECVSASDLASHPHAAVAATAAAARSRRDGPVFELPSLPSFMSSSSSSSLTSDSLPALPAPPEPTRPNPSAAPLAAATVAEHDLDAPSTTTTTINDGADDGADDGGDTTAVATRRGQTRLRALSAPTT